jgi:hypothetical protein
MTAGSEIAAGKARPASAALNLGLKKMPISSPRYAFTAVMVSGAPPDPWAQGLYPVWDAQRKDYRFINLDTVTEIRYGGKVEKVDG